MGGVTLKDGRERILTHPPNLEFLLQRRTDFLRHYLHPEERVLEVGAGLGIVGLYVEGLRLTSTDIHREAWVHAVADAMVLPFRDSAFDSVVCLNVLHHLTQPLLAIKEMARVLRAGGRLLITEPHASLAMRMVITLTGHEYVDPNVDPFGPESCQSCADPAMNGNNAIGDLIFSDHARFQAAFPFLKVEHDRLVECVTFLNSGGVSYRVPCVPLPQKTLEWLGKVDRWLAGFPDLFPLCREVVLKKQAA